MTTTQLIPRLTEAECEEREKRINAHAIDIRIALVELYEGEAWAVRGYPNWREYVVAKFEQSESHLYRLLKAGLMERELDLPIGQTPEGQLRELRQLTDPEVRRLAWQAATQAQGKVTAQIVKMAVKSAAELFGEAMATRSTELPKGAPSLGGVNINLAASMIAERMLETRNRQIQHIADSIAGRWTKPVDFQSVKSVVRVSPSTGLVLLKFEPEVAKQFLSLLDSEGLRVTMSLPKVKKPESEDL